MNNVVIAGRLGRRPELKPGTRTTVTEFSVATDERRKDGDSWVSDTEWHNVVVFGRKAENCAEYLDKGQWVVVQGRLKTDSWEDKDSGKKMYRTKIVAFEVEFGPKGEKGARKEERRSRRRDEEDDDIPF